MTIRKNTGQGGAAAVARLNDECAATEKTGRRGKPLTRKRAEVLEAQRTKDSNFGKSKPARPTANEVEQNIDGAAKVPFHRLPFETQRELRRRRKARSTRSRKGKKRRKRTG